MRFSIDYKSLIADNETVVAVSAWIVSDQAAAAPL